MGWYVGPSLFLTLTHSYSLSIHLTMSGLAFKLEDMFSVQGKVRDHRLM